MAPDDEDDGDLYDDEFDFVDEDDDDLSDLDDDDDAAEDDSAADDEGDDSELDRPEERADEAADSEPADQPARRPAPARHGRRAEARSVDDQRDLFDRDDRGREERPDDRRDDAEAVEAEAPEDHGPPPPPANYRVHIYEYEEFKRTIDRPFTAEDAEAFASEFNRTSKPYGRFALAGKDDAKPRKTLD